MPQCKGKPLNCTDACALHSHFEMVATLSHLWQSTADTQGFCYCWKPERNAAIPRKADRPGQEKKKLFTLICNLL